MVQWLLLCGTQATVTPCDPIVYWGETCHNRGDVISHKDESRSIVQGPMLIVQEGVMALSKEERCRELARLVGIPLGSGHLCVMPPLPGLVRARPWLGR